MTVTAKRLLLLAAAVAFCGAQASSMQGHTFFYPSILDRAPHDGSRIVIYDAYASCGEVAHWVTDFGAEFGFPNVKVKPGAWYVDRMGIWMSDSFTGWSAVNDRKICDPIS